MMCMSQECTKVREWVFCNGLFVMVTLFTVTFCTIKNPYGAHNEDIHFSSLIWCHFHFAFLSSSLYRNPLGRGVKPLSASPPTPTTPGPHFLHCIQCGGTAPLRRLWRFRKKYFAHYYLLVS